MVKNVLFLAPHTKIAGGTRVIFQLADLLGQSGFKVTVAVPKYGNKSVLSIFNNGVHFTLIKVPNFDHRKLPHHDVLIDFCDNLVNIRTKALKILFLQGFGTQNFQLELSRIKAKHNHVIVVSKWLGNVVKSTGIKNVSVIPPGIGELFTPQSITPNRLVSIGAIYHNAPAKNLKIFIEACKRVHDRNNKSRAIFVSSKIIPSLDAYGFEYSSFINPPQYLLPIIYSNCDVWVNTSINEGFGLPTLEAMACGCPVVSIKNFGLDEYLINKQNCMLLQQNATGNELYSSIIELLNNKELRDKVITNGRALAAQFTWKRCVHQWVTVLRGL